MLKHARGRAHTVVLITAPFHAAHVTPPRYLPPIIPQHLWLIRHGPQLRNHDFFVLKILKMIFF